VQREKILKPQDDLQEGWVASLGHARYLEILDLQRELVELRQENKIPDILLLVEHEPVITLGRRGNMANILSTPDEIDLQGIQIHQVERGGDVTYHGPGQLVGYPVINLSQRRLGVRTFVQLLEESIIRALAEFGIRAGRKSQHRGVWVKGQKIAALGVAVRRWVSFHGFALNVSPNLDHYCYIYPCGLKPEQVTSMEVLLGEAPPMVTVCQKLMRRFTELIAGQWRNLSVEELVQQLRRDEEIYQTADIQT
jgi:lipoyl(octanoyl) transferase